MKRIALEGKKFGKLVVIEELEGNKCMCECECGEYKVTSRASIMKGRTKSCGCLRRSNLVGKSFYRWTVLKLSHRDNGHIYWECECVCGTIGFVNTNTLNSGKSQSCRCLHLEKITTHGDSGTKLYKVWDSMIYRCYNKDCHAYDGYGGRGINVYDEWVDDYRTFKLWAMQNGYSEGLSLDRIDNDGNYTPDNCRWATSKEQQNNTRTNTQITYKGLTKTLPQWADEFGIKQCTLRARLNNNWDVERAFLTPVRRRSLKR